MVRICREKKKEREREKRKGNTQSFLGTPGFPVHMQDYEKLLFSWSHWYESLLQQKNLLEAMNIGKQLQI